MFRVSKATLTAYETLLVMVQEIMVPSRKAGVFQLDLPLSELKSGFYTCQVNVIDDAAGHFMFCEWHAGAAVESSHFPANSAHMPHGCAAPACMQLPELQWVLS